jgi:hypothetical protein
MSDLVDFAIEAHGGWAHWQPVSGLRAHTNIGGGVWALKGLGWGVCRRPSHRLDAQPAR